MKKTKRIAKIEWVPKLVRIGDIKPTPKNYKIKNQLGLERLQTMLAEFGLAGTVVVNTDMVLIDGNTRLQEAKKNGDKKMWVSIPSRTLTKYEFKEMSAMFDGAKAGDVDYDSINKDFGSSKDFFNKFNLEVPMHLLDKLGKARARAEEQDFEYKESKDGKEPMGQFRMVQLYLKPKEEEFFRKMEDYFMKKFNTDDTTQTTYKALKTLYFKYKPKK